MMIGTGGTIDSFALNPVITAKTDTLDMHPLIIIIQPKHDDSPREMSKTSLLYSLVITTAIFALEPVSEYIERIYQKNNNMPVEISQKP